jgi:hypothetical protein
MLLLLLACQETPAVGVGLQAGIQQSGAAAAAHPAAAAADLRRQMPA